MRVNESAIIAIYRNGVHAIDLVHRGDGGAHYMSRLLRSAINYARAQYIRGDIIEILLSNSDTTIRSDFADLTDVKNIYYINVRTDTQACNKVYQLKAYAPIKGKLTETLIPRDFVSVPKEAKSIR